MKEGKRKFPVPRKGTLRGPGARLETASHSTELEISTLNLLYFRVIQIFHSSNHFGISIEVPFFVLSFLIHLLELTAWVGRIGGEIHTQVNTFFFFFYCHWLSILSCYKVVPRVANVQCVCFLKIDYTGNF